MSKRNNVNPDHYKIAGRARQGEDIVQEVERRQFAQSRPGNEGWKPPTTTRARRPAASGRSRRRRSD